MAHPRKNARLAGQASPITGTASGRNQFKIAFTRMPSLHKFLMLSRCSQNRASLFTNTTLLRSEMTRPKGRSRLRTRGSLRRSMLKMEDFRLTISTPAGRLNGYGAERDTPVRTCLLCGSNQKCWALDPADTALVDIESECIKPNLFVSSGSEEPQMTIEGRSTKWQTAV